VAWAVGLVACAVLIAERTGSYWLFLMVFGLAAVGSAAFHPQGTMHAGGVPGHAAVGTAVFFLGGQTGLAAGPLLVGILLDRVGLSGIYLAAFGILPVVVFMAWALAGSRGGGAGATISGGENPRHVETRWFSLGVLTAVFTLRGWAFMGTAFFLPLLFRGFGWSSTAQGALTALYWIGGGVAGVIMGRVADRWGRRQTVVVTLLVGAVGLFFLPVVSSGFAYLLALISGVLVGASHSVLIVVAQELLPLRRGLASGIALGFVFAVGAVATWGNGLLAEIWSLPAVLQAGGLMAAVAGVLTMFLPATREISSVEPVRLAAAR
jgi:FSR family fosmidomycin resistance protein-like MFS transporter